MPHWRRRLDVYFTKNNWPSFVFPGMNDCYLNVFLGETAPLKENVSEEFSVKLSIDTDFGGTSTISA